MIKLYECDDAAGDLDKLEDDGFVTEADLLDTFMTQLGESEEALWKLTAYDAEHHTPLFSTRAIECFHDAGYNVYRIRPLRLVSDYRIIYGYDGQNDEIHVLAYAHKKPHDAPKGINPDHYDYEPDHPLSHRIRDEYDQIGIPKIPRRR